MSETQSISALVQAANPTRSPANLSRRVVKLFEEIGEVAEAWLNVTSESNGKAKNWADLHEEIADCLIVALDIEWTQLPTERRPGEILIGDSKTLGRYADFEATLFDLAFDLATIGKFLAERQYARVRIHIARMTESVWLLATMRLPDQAADTTAQQIAAQLHAMVVRKLAKWADNRSTMAVVTDDV
jgi:hypothetical protein